MNINCPHCGTEYEIDETEYGRFVKCESCGKGFVVGTAMNQQMPEAALLRTGASHMRRDIEREVDSAAANLSNRQSPSAYCTRIPEYRYFLAWLAYAVASWLGSTVIGMVIGAAIGAVMGANGASVSAIADICAIVGTVVSIPVGYFSFRYIASAILNRWR